MNREDNTIHSPLESTDGTAILNRRSDSLSSDTTCFATSWRRVQAARVPLVASTIVVMFATLATAILSTPYLGDDGINRGIRVSNWNFWDFLAHFNGVWIAADGRFFPGSISWTYWVFYLFDSRLEYKLVLVFILAAAIASAAGLIRELTGSLRAVATMTLALLAVLQLRVWYDGLDSFAGLVPLTLALTFFATILCIRRTAIGWKVVAAMAYMLALFTYETVLLFLPVLAIAVVFKTRSWWRTLPLMVPALIEVVIVVIFRGQVGSHTGPAYTFSLEPLIVAKTFAKQLLATLPYSQWWLASVSAPRVSLTLVLLCAVFIALPVYLCVLLLSRRVSPVSPRVPLLLTLFGVWLWIIPSALIAVTYRWQVELPRGQGYLAVIYGYFGIAMLVLSIWMSIGSRVSLRGSRVSTIIWAQGSAIVLAGVATATAAGNLAVAGSYWP